MRTTVTLDSDTEQIVRLRMKQRRVSFKRALNDAIREGSRELHADLAFHTQPVAMGAPRVNVDQALQLSSQLEDDEFIRSMRSGS